jgi:hypothetical protein
MPRQSADVTSQRRYTKNILLYGIRRIDDCSQPLASKPHHWSTELKPKASLESSCGAIRTMKWSDCSTEATTEQPLILRHRQDTLHNHWQDGLSHIHIHLKIEKKRIRKENPAK